MILPLHIEISDKLRICESRLVATINATQTTLEVTSGEAATNFPSYFPFLMLIESEIVNATSVATDTYTIEREARSTTAASHTSGTPLRAVVYSEDIKRIHGFLTEKTTNYTATSSDSTILVDGNVKITLPAVADSAGFGYTIKNVGTNKVTIDANGTEKIDGEPTVILNLQFSYVTIVCDGDEWFIIGGQNVKIEELVKDGNEIQGNILKLLHLFKRALKKMSNLDLKED